MSKLDKLDNSCSISTENCSFSCTGYTGAKVWKKLHSIVKEEIDCETCSDHAVKNMKGFHDHFNAGLGKPVFDHKNYIAFTDEVVCVRDKYCKRSGRC